MDGNYQMNKKINKNMYPQIILSDTKIEKIILKRKMLYIIFAKDGFSVKNAKDNHYYRTKTSRILYTDFNCEEIIIKLIKKYKILGKTVDIQKDIEISDFIRNINSKKWSCEIVKEFYSENGCFYILRLKDGGNKYWCYMDLLSKDIIYIWKEEIRDAKFD